MKSKKHSQSQKSPSRPSSSKRSRRSKSTPKDMFAQDHETALFVPKGELDLFHYMVDHIGDEVMVVDEKARIVFVNKAAVKGLGYAKKDLLYRPWMNFLKDKISVPQWQKKYFREVKKRKKPISYSVERIAKGGKTRTFDVTVVYMSYKTKDYVLAVGRNVTERVACQVNLEESEKRYRLLSEHAADGILMLDGDGVTLYANKAAGKMFRTAASKLVGTSFESHMDKSSLSKAGKFFRRVKRGIQVIHQELEIRSEKGTSTLTEFSASPIFRGSKVVLVHVIIRDVSQKKEMEALIRESEKREALQYFITGTTREIQQPLKGLVDHSRNLIDKYKDRHFEYIGYKEFRDIMNMLQTMHDQVKYCFDTTDRLISLNRRKAKLESNCSNVNHSIRETVGTLKHSLEVSDIKLKLKLNPQLPHVACGPLDLHQVLNNILTNAIQSLPGGGGTIQIKTVYQKTNDSVRIDCKDDGVGIPGEILAYVFDPFFTTKSRGLEKSSGLGLSIAYSIVKGYRGEISIKSDFRKGTFVTVVLPAYRPKKKRKS